MTALGHAAFLVSLEGHAAARASAALVQARVLSQGGVLRALRQLETDTLPHPPAGGAPLAEGGSEAGSFLVRLHALGREIFRVEGVGRAPLGRGGPQRVEDRVSRLLWALSPIERLREARAVVEHGAGIEAAAGGVTLDALTDAGIAPSPAGCLDRRASLDSVTHGLWIAPERMSVGSGAPGIPRLGMLDHEALLAAADLRFEGAVTPGPRIEGSRCLQEAASNWGSPTDPLGPCGGYRPVVASEADLTLIGGEGQGVLLVAGDLHLSSGAYYAGVVRVGGSLVLDGGAVIEGVARVAGRVHVTGGSRISGALCPALLGLSAATGLRRPIELPASGWLRPH